VKSWPNIHNATKETKETKDVGVGASWHCNCAGTFSWCSYTTCYAKCDVEAKDAEEKNNLPVAKPVEEKALLTVGNLPVAKPAEEKARTATVGAQNHEWDCNCQGLYDVCSFTTCTYTTNCETGVKSWPNIHNATKETKDVSVGASWHCNCSGTFSWCSYTTCYAKCDAEVAEISI